MSPKTVKKALKDAIQAMTDYKWLFSARPGTDNTRNRKFPFQKVIPFILAFRGGTLNHEIMDFFGLDPSTGTSSAFTGRSPPGTLPRHDYRARTYRIHQSLPGIRRDAKPTPVLHVPADILPSSPPHTGLPFCSCTKTLGLP